MSKIIYTTTSTGLKNYCILCNGDRKRVRTVGSIECLSCYDNMNATDPVTRGKGIVLCRNNNAEVQDEHQFSNR